MQENPFSQYDARYDARSGWAGRFFRRNTENFPPPPSIVGDESLSIQPAEPEITIPTNNAEIAKLISAAANIYGEELRKFLPPEFTPRVDFSTSLALLHAVEEHAQNNEWKPQDLYFIRAGTVAALRTAGFSNAQDSLAALLNGATGHAGEIVDGVLPEGASGILKFTAKMIVGAAHFGNVFRVADILRNERTVETRLQKLVRIQQEMLEDPRRTKVLLSMLNPSKNFGLVTNRALLSQEAEAHLMAISPCSLEDMRAVKRFFDSIEKWGRSQIGIEGQRIDIDRFTKRVLAAGVNLGMITGESAAALAQTLILLAGGTVGGTVGGLGLGIDKTAELIDSAGKRIQANRANRGKAPLRLPNLGVIFNRFRKNR